MRVLILTGRFGMGHMSVADTLAQDIQLYMQGTQVVVEDILETAWPMLSGAIYGTYGKLIKNTTALFNMAYRFTEHRKNNSMQFFQIYFGDCIQRLIQEHQPDVMISTMPLSSYLASEYKRKSGHQIPLITCITDVKIHSAWLGPHTDMYWVADESTRVELLALGVSARKVRVTGIPVKAAFRKLYREEPDKKRPARANGDKPHLVVMGGGLGLLPKNPAFYAALDGMNEVEVTILTGRNQALAEQLQQQYRHIRAVGFVCDVEKYMAKADLILTKPGGITLFECIFAELPMLVFGQLMEQEQQNARFIVDKGIGRVCMEKETVFADMAALLKDGDALEKMRSNMRRIKLTIASDAICASLDEVFQKRELQKAAVDRFVYE